jgi:hypothetical protein
MSEGMTAAKLFPFLLASVGLAALHLLQKLVPAGANAGAILAAAYTVAAFACIAAFPLLTPGKSLAEGFGTLSWHSLALGAAIACCEIGVLLAYRAGWPVGTTGISMSAVMALILFPIGVMAFGEALTLQRAVGAAMLLGGLYLLSAK